MTDEQVQRIINAIREVNKRETTEYQPCPICNGSGYVFPVGDSSASTLICNYCHGTKTVIKSITK